VEDEMKLNFDEMGREEDMLVPGHVPRKMMGV
jgi:hypothetical protein